MLSTGYLSSLSTQLFMLADFAYINHMHAQNGLSHRHIYIRNPKPLSMQVSPIGCPACLQHGWRWLCTHISTQRQDSVHKVVEQNSFGIQLLPHFIELCNRIASCNALLQMLQVLFVHSCWLDLGPVLHCKVIWK